MARKEGHPDKVVRVGGREFLLYKYYEPFCEREILDYPDFGTHPAHTDEGRPFVVAVQEGCEYGQSGDPGDLDPGDCGGCLHFYQEPPPNDAIGVCLCDARRRMDWGESATGERRGVKE